jgi:hypothetical protein
MPEMVPGTSEVCTKPFHLLPAQSFRWTQFMAQGVAARAGLRAAA